MNDFILDHKVLLWFWVSWERLLESSHWLIYGQFSYELICIFNQIVSRFVIKRKMRLTSTENFTAAITTWCKFSVIAIAAVNLVGLGSKLLVHQGNTTHIAQETCFMPMFVLVAQVLIQTNNKLIYNQITLCILFLTLESIPITALHSSQLLANTVS